MTIHGSLLKQVIQIDSIHLIQESGSVSLGIFIFLVMISSTFSERIIILISRIHEFPRRSNSSFEAPMTNTGGNRVAQAVGNHSPFSLSWFVDSRAPVTSVMTPHYL